MARTRKRRIIGKNDSGENRKPSEGYGSDLVLAIKCYPFKRPSKHDSVGIKNMALLNRRFNSQKYSFVFAM